MRKLINGRFHHWDCKSAKLISEDGRIIADAARNWMEVYSYSPKVNRKVTREELEQHLNYDKNRPNDIIFHFRNQYRHWDCDWGFNLTYNEYKRLDNNQYTVEMIVILILVKVCYKQNSHTKENMRIHSCLLDILIIHHK